MIRQIEEMAFGKINIERPSELSFDDKITFQVYAGQKYSDSFKIFNNSDIPLDGDAVCNCHNVTSLKTAQVDKGLVVSFVFDAKALKATDEVVDVITVITNAGEFEVNFRASIVTEKLSAEVGEIRNLDEFIRFYYINPSEAEKLYHSEAFRDFLTNTRARLYYKKLGSVEEFLIAIGAKKRTLFSVDKEEISFSELIVDDKGKKIRITKKNNGEILLKVMVDSPFIEVSKNVIRDEDFIGAGAVLDVELKKEKLHLGENLGQIIIRNNFQEERIRVSAFLSSEIDITREKYISDKKKFLTLCRSYEDYLSENMVTGAFVKEAVAIADSFAYEDILYRLIKAYALFINSQFQEFRWLMADIKNEIDEDYEGAYMLYNCLMYMSESDSDLKHKLFTKIVDVYQSNIDNSFVRYCMLLIDSDSIDSKNKLMMIVRWIKEGENSPFFFGYAVKLLNEYPFFLTDLKREMLLILNWGSKKNCIGRALTEQILSLYSTAGRYDVLLDRILTRCQVKYPTRDTLTAVCAYRIKGELTRDIDHIWYRKAIEEDIKLTGLYEYYIASMTRGTFERLPGQVCLYFQYNNFLSRKQKSLLYVNVVSFKEADPKTYEVYKKTIKDYVISELNAGHIDESLALLYSEFFDEVEPDREMLDSLSTLLYMSRFTCSNRSAKYVYVIHEKLEKIRSYPINDGVAYFPVYKGVCVYVLADENNFVFVDNEACDEEPLFENADMMVKALELGSLKISYILHYLLTKQSMMVLNDREVEFVRVLLASDEISREYKSRLVPSLVKYHRGSYESDAMIKNIDVRDLDESSRAIYVEELISECIYGKAYEFVEYYGPKSVSLPALEQIIMYCLTYIKDYDEELHKLMKYAVSQGTKKQIIYKYLDRFMRGTADEIYDAWKKAVGVAVECRGLTEKLLFLMVFTGEIHSFAKEVYACYVKGENEPRLCEAYANYFAYSYIYKSYEPPAEAFGFLMDKYNRSDDMPDYIAVALLKFISCVGNVSGREIRLCEDILWRLTGNGMYFGFYKNLPKELLVRFHLYDKYIITVKSPDGDVTISYRLDDGETKKVKPENVFFDYYTFVKDAEGSNALYYSVDEKGKRFEYRGGMRKVPGTDPKLNNKYTYISTDRSSDEIRAIERSVDKLFVPV